MNRVDQLNKQFPSSSPQVSKETITVDGQTYPQVVDNHPDKGIKSDFFSRNGWGYKDSGFYYDKPNNTIKSKGHRYMFGETPLPTFMKFLSENLNIDP
jgi:hypothetical protein